MKQRIILLLMFFLAACRGGAPVPTATPTAVPPTATILPTATPEPTATMSATAVPPTNTPIPTPAGPPDLRYLGAAVEAELADFDGLSSLYIVDLQTGQEISLDPDIAIAGMSLLKIPLLVETYRMLDRPPDLEQTKLITETAALSGNFTANLLLEQIAGQPNPFIGAEILTQSMQRLGLYNTFLAVPYDKEARPEYLSTYLTPANRRTDVTTRPDPHRQTTIRDLGLLLRMIYNCAENESGPLLTIYPDELTPMECAEILEMMQLNRIDALIEAGVPEDVPLAHKHGWIGDTHGDAGVVFSPGGDYVLAVALYYPDWLEWEISSPIIEEISRLAYAHFNDPEAYSPAVLAAAPAFSGGETGLPTPPPVPDLPQAIVNGTQGIGLTLREAPGGAEVVILPEGTPLNLLDAAPVTLNNITWRKVSTHTGQEGWVGEDFLLMQ